MVQEYHRVGSKHHLQLGTEDYTTPLPIENKRDSLQDGTIFNPMSEPCSIDLQPLEGSAQEATTSWRPAGAQAQNRISAGLSLILSDYPLFANVHVAWTSCLFGKGSIFRRLDGKHFVSLGFETWAALLWPLRKIGNKYFTMTNPGAQLIWHSNKVVADPRADAPLPELFHGIPFAIRSPAHLPTGCQSLGVVYEQVGDGMKLLPYALKRGTPLFMEQLRNFCSSFGVKVVKVGGSLNKKAYVTALVKYCFPDLAELEQESIVARSWAGACSHRWLQFLLNSLIGV
jgi:hypothetical protein